LEKTLYMFPTGILGYEVASFKAYIRN